MSGEIKLFSYIILQKKVFCFFFIQILLRKLRLRLNLIILNLTSEEVKIKNK